MILLPVAFLATVTVVTAQQPDFAAIDKALLDDIT
eukprot:CAMPEP_0196150298 /NCGR_PEP_ID=MMETSP0910-20130528/31510_1 /TAXON_ID=49265 /ORGANISM="Thalassiosira rotula, Strain GSO102" /LENGTH=34 /DNA_ID= /DNA_START= /DNA_END= /DNA_ORIENTATION=